MYVANPQAQPGFQGPFTSQPRQIFYSGREFAEFASPPLIIDGTNSRNPANASTSSSLYTCLLWAGMLFGRITATNKWRPSILGLTTAAYTSGGTTITSDVNTVAEVARLIANNNGSPVNLSYLGPAVASTGLAVLTTGISASAASGTTITTTSVGANLASGSAIMPSDGSQVIRYILGEDQNVYEADGLGNVYDAQTGFMCIGGGTINTGMIVNYSSADSTVQTYIKAALRVYATGFAFLDDIAP